MKYSVTVAARILGVSPDTLKRWEKEGKIPRPERTFGDHRRYSADDIERIRQMASNSVQNQ